VAFNQGGTGEEGAMNNHEWLTVKEYAELKRVTPRTVRDWIKDAKIDAERTAGDRGQWRIKISRVA